MLSDYISNLKNVQCLCDDFESAVKNIFFDKGNSEESSLPFIVDTREYRMSFEPIKACVELCRMLRLSFLGFDDQFYECASALGNVLAIKNLTNFMMNLKGVRVGFEWINEQLSAFYSTFDEEEKERINEAIHNYLEGCNYSCVAMSVSAAESRLLKLMCLVSPESERELDKKTLGQLMKEYIGNKSKYSNVVPERHEPLLQLCNTYRTFSVHPKRQKVTVHIATSIFNLAIEFLTDPNTRPEVIEAQQIASQGGE